MDSPDPPARKPKFSSMSRQKPDASNTKDSIRKRMFRLKFSPTESVAVNLREYGLMQTSRQADTPYPRIEQPVDPSLLKARLVESKHIHSSSSKGLKTVSSNQSTYSADPDGTHMPPTPSVEAGPGPVRDSTSLLLGTPHPRKGQAIDPKSLIRRLSVAKTKRNSLGAQRSSYGHLPASRASLERGRTSDGGARSSHNLMSPAIKGALGIGTPHPKKGYILNARELTKHLEATTGAEPHTAPAPKSSRRRRRSKQVTVALKFAHIEDVKSTSCLSMNSGRQTGSFLTSDGSILTVTSRDSGTMKPSFEERRRLFYQDEFTIAKNGRKMSDIIMAVPQKPVVEHKDKGHDQEVDTELEEFIRTQGLIKTQRDQLTITRMPSAASSRRQSETDSVRSYRSRSSRRSSTHQGMKRNRTRRNIKFSSSEREKRTYSD
ncbi:uncharacterized protein LOC111070205 [Drosophila obscura]|uniref:uncharacterized protein LOC111070205 n=1 Tax=Drosophila obscura TaxID=7282 RepID=UPI000BA1565C|nr:uncharacterized protein LOC111070205 [Drosophila obscura]